MSSEKPQIPNSLNEHWMPFSSNRDFKANPRLIVEAKGVYLKNHQGKTQIDASSAPVSGCPDTNLCSGKCVCLM